MKFIHSNAILLLYGCGTILFLATLLIQLEPSGVSMMEKRDAITRLSTPPSREIR
jgi:hypothetical protein